MPTTNKKHQTIALAAGGTGGHLFPAQGFAEKLLELGHHPLIICDQRTNEFIKGDLAKIDSLKIFAPKPSSNIFANILNGFKMIPTIFRIRKEMRKQNVSKVIGFGGYPSFPTMLAGLSLGLELYIHEQNAVLGRVNRLLSIFARKVFLSFPNTQKLGRLSESKVLVVGNIIRKQVLECVNSSQNASRDPDKFNILIIGGSQGARILSEVAPEAIKLLPKNLQARLTINQQSRGAFLVATRESYSHTKASVEVQEFFDDIAVKLSDADLVIARSGASTVCELAFLSKASILVPLRIATDNHQRFNAAFLEEAGAAIVIEEYDLTPSSLSNQILSILSDPDELADMSASAGSVALPNAADEIAKEIGL